MIALRARPAPAARPTPASPKTHPTPTTDAAPVEQHAQPAPNLPPVRSIPAPDPAQPTPSAPSEQRVYIPLGFNPDLSAWVPIGELHGLPNSELPDQLGAARVCAAHLLAQWTALARLARTLRAFCEHPGLIDFDGDGIDGDMLRDAARDLTLAVDWLDRDITHLLDPADPDQAILIAGEPHRVSPETGLIEPYSSAPASTDVAGE